MTKEERIEQLNNQRFYLSMKDHWTNADFEQDRKWYREILSLHDLPDGAVIAK